MKLLLEFADRHTFTTTVVATLSGFAGVVLDHLEQATQIVAFFGACAGTATAILGTIVMWRRAMRNEGQRRRHFRDEPFEDHLP